ncbi:POK7 protein, partial [Pitta sordida]|nr:POK7 protein [Pitta sordida]
VTHVTGIPHSSTGQAIVERANRILKEFLGKQKTTEEKNPQNRLHKALFTLNFLSLPGDSEVPPSVIH